MRRLGPWSVVAVLAVVLAPTAAVGAGSSSAPLPLTRVRLYETGVGYFERSGAMPEGDVALPVPAGHLDDALKTLVVLGGDAKVSGVAFSSSVSRDMARRLAGLPDDDRALLGFSELARSFKGANVALQTRAGALTGRLVEVLEPGQGELERCKQSDEAAKAKGAESTKEAEMAGDCRVQRGSLMLLTSAGELRRVASADVVALRPTEAVARGRLGAALDALSQRGAQTERELGVLSSGGGKITLGYVAEAPVWRSTYRVVLGDARQAKLQGWALLHNDTDEDWRAVQVELVNGRPNSFLYPLAAPRYTRRELVTPPEDLSSVPQLFDTTVDNLWSGGLNLTGEGEGGGGYGEGIGLGSIGTRGHGAGSAIQASDELSLGNLASLTPAVGVEAAALFRYTLPSKLALRAHASVLVPFVDASLKARQIAWFAVDASAAASALHVTNDTHQTLPAGTLSVFGDGGFAGEALLPRTKPNETQILAYGVDLDVELTRDDGKASEEPRLFAFEGNNLVQHYVRRRSQGLKLKNRSQSARSVYVALDVIDNARVDGAAELGHDAASDKTYVVLEVEGGKERTQSLKLEEGLKREFAFASLSSARLRAFAAAPTTQPAQRARLLAAAEQRLLAEIRRGAGPRRKAELEQAVADVARVRENARILGAMKADEGEAMARRVVELEAQIVGLRRRIAELESEAVGFEAAAKRELSRL